MEIKKLIAQLQKILEESIIENPILKISSDEEFNTIYTRGDIQEDETGNYIIFGYSGSEEIEDDADLPPIEFEMEHGDDWGDR